MLVLIFRNNQGQCADESEGEEEGLVASGSASEENNSGSDENKYVKHFYF